AASVSSPSVSRRSTGGWLLRWGGRGGPGFRKQLSRLRTGPVEVADKAPHFTTLGVEQDRGRKHFSAERPGQAHARVLISVEGRDPVRLEEHDHRCVWTTVLAYREDADVGVRPREGVERRQLLHTRRAPARPQVHQQRLAGEIGRVHRLAFGIVERLGWSGTAAVAAIDA